MTRDTDENEDVVKNELKEFKAMLDRAGVAYDESSHRGLHQSLRTTINVENAEFIFDGYRLVQVYCGIQT